MKLKPFEAHVHFPTYPSNRQPFRTGFDADVRRPGMCVTYQRAKNGRLVMLRAELLAKAVK